MSRRSDRLTQLGSLLDNGFYSTAFQPIVETETGDAIGFESLLRGPEGSLLSEPGRIFNERGLLSEDWRGRIDYASIQAAVRTGKHLPGHALIFINIMGTTMLRLTGELDCFLELLADVSIEPSRIVLEVSENTGSEAADMIAAMLHRLRSAGIRVALDDIGVRSPYLYHLLCLEPEFIKLDRLFVQGIDRDKRKQDLVQSMAGMAETMGARLIAEGIESNEEFTAIRALEVPLTQGYFLGSPKPARQWGPFPWSRERVSVLADGELQRAALPPNAGSGGGNGSQQDPGVGHVLTWQVERGSSVEQAKCAPEG